MKVLYNLLGVFFIPLFSFLTKKKGYPLSLRDRFVLYKTKNRQKKVWFHCASVGELNVAKPLIKEYSKKYPVVITVFSPRGIDYAKRLFPDLEVRAVPFDLSFFVKRFLKKHNPSIFLVVEEEFWYNLITETAKNTPVISINTRISPKSFRNYKKYYFFFQKIFNSISLFLVRSEKDVSFLRKLVKDKKKIILCGDLKLVSSFPDKDIYLKIDGRPLIFAGSTHFPEEEILLSVFKNLKKEYPHLSLVIAPRHMENIKGVISLVKRKGFSYSLRSETNKIETDVYIIDTIGELAGIYKYATVVFVGGTIAPIGGHNILEPALLNKPVIIGSHYEKIMDIFNFLRKKKAVVSVQDEKELEYWIKKALEGEFKSKVDLVKEQEKILTCYTRNINRFLER